MAGALLSGVALSSVPPAGLAAASGVFASLGAPPGLTASRGPAGEFGLAIGPDLSCRFQALQKNLFLRFEISEFDLAKIELQLQLR